MKWIFFIVIFVVALPSKCQRSPSFPLSSNSLRQIGRALSSTPPGRKPTVDNIIIRHYTNDLSSPRSYLIGSSKKLLGDTEFNITKPTVLYAHGYVELSTDESIMAIVNAYVQLGTYNLLLLDWSNIAFENYIATAITIPEAGRTVGQAILKLINGGVSSNNLHFVGHSMGAHLTAVAARYLKDKGYKIPRLTGLDPAYPGFYTSLLPVVSQPLSTSDAIFVDMVHTDGGWFGAPDSVGHADFWPNGGSAKQPGCTTSLPLTFEDFCSHWRSWAFWAESVSGGEFLARRCSNYDDFLRGQCMNEAPVHMGLRATSDLRGNYYLRTAARPPFALGERGAT